jgi:hypothetical protein
MSWSSKRAPIYWHFASAEAEDRSGLGVEPVYILMTSKTQKINYKL